MEIGQGERHRIGYHYIGSSIMKPIKADDNAY